ncbi:TPA: DUF987 domain-containing protein [Escherichia coli]
MKIISKSDASWLHHQHLPLPWYGPPHIPGLLAVYVERRQGHNGPSACLMSSTLN